jgi:heme oxygenase (biliverdin-producing, ferredoxin)
MTIPLAARLRAATKDLHHAVERAGMMPSLLRGRLPRADYLLLLRSLHAIYQALEAGLERHAVHPGLQPLWQPALARGPALAQDLEALHGPGWALALAVQPAACDYAAHLQRLAASRPALLAAHAYVRYLGDLSGGQVLARIVSQSLQLPAGQGVAFYDFGPAERVAALGQALRQGLDRIAGDEAEAAAVVDEACSAFGRHRELFEQLDRPLALQPP